MILALAQVLVFACAFPVFALIYILYLFLHVFIFFLFALTHSSFFLMILRSTCHSSFGFSLSFANLLPCC